VELERARGPWRVLWSLIAGCRSSCTPAGSGLRNWSLGLEVIMGRCLVSGGEAELSESQYELELSCFGTLAVFRPGGIIRRETLAQER